MLQEKYFERGSSSEWKIFIGYRRLGGKFCLVTENSLTSDAWWTPCNSLKLWSRLIALTRWSYKANYPDEISHEFLKIFVVCMACIVYIENDFMACSCLVIVFPWNLTLLTIVLFLCVVIIRHNSSPNSSPKQRRRTEGAVEMEPCHWVP